MSDMAKPPPMPAWLVEASKRAKAGEKVFVTVREIITNFQRERRGSNTVFTIRRALHRLGMTTNPRFYSVNLDCLVELVPATSPPAGDDEREDARQPIVTFGMLRCVEDQRVIRGRPRTDNGQGYAKWIVRPDDNLVEAAILLSAGNVDYVPVGMDETSITGVISWDDIAMQDILSRRRDAIACGKVCKKPVFVDQSDSVYDKKDEISRHGHVLVRDVDKRVFAVVRASDLTVELLRLTENFLLLHEIENLLRLLVEMTELGIEDIRPMLEERRRKKVDTLDQLQFSEYSQVLNKPLVKQRLLEGYGIPELMTEHLALQVVESARKTRNAVVHFHPDENNELAQRELSTHRDFIRNLIENASKNEPSQ